MNAAETPTFSILIPTRNGAQYLPYTVASVLSSPSQKFELVISDNHSDDGTAAYLDTLQDPRVRRFKPEKTLSMVAHFEFIVTLARGEWVTVLGDDDGVMPFFFEELEALDLYAVTSDAIVFRRANYFWPGCEEIYRKNVVAFVPADWRARVFNAWGILLCLASIIDYTYLPQLYTSGLVRRSYIETIKLKTANKFFHGGTPDASSAATLALHARKHVRIETPLFWTGTSPKSVGFSQASGSQKTRSDEFDQLNAREKQPIQFFPPQIKNLFDLTVIFYEALLLNPSAGPFWSSRVVRNIFLAGLVRKDPSNLDRIQAAYGAALTGFELRSYIKLIDVFARRHAKKQLRIDRRQRLPMLLSEERARFPTLKEASIEAETAWRAGVRAGARRGSWTSKS